MRWVPDLGNCDRSEQDQNRKYHAYSATVASQAQSPPRICCNSIPRYNRARAVAWGVHTSKAGPILVIGESVVQEARTPRALIAVHPWDAPVPS